MEANHEATDRWLESALDPSPEAVERVSRAALGPARTGRRVAWVVAGCTAAALATAIVLGPGPRPLSAPPQPPPSEPLALVGTGGSVVVRGVAPATGRPSSPTLIIVTGGGTP